MPRQKICVTLFEFAKWLEMRARIATEKSWRKVFEWPETVAHIAAFSRPRTIQKRGNRSAGPLKPRKFRRNTYTPRNRPVRWKWLVVEAVRRGSFHWLPKSRRNTATRPTHRMKPLPKERIWRGLSSRRPKEHRINSRKPSTPLWPTSPPRRMRPARQYLAMPRRLR